MRAMGGVLLLAFSAARPAAADPACGAVEVRFAPGAADLQFAVWIEDAQGNFKDTAFITRLTGQFGLGNRPGGALLKTDFRWPYGRREMVMPVWAHRHGAVHTYPKIVMGGACGNSPSAECPDHSLCGGDCIDSTIAYHSKVSSGETFFCAPNGGNLDAMSCATPLRTLSKGAFADAPAFSLYPPRADLNTFSAATDSPNAKTFAMLNDLQAVSGATPKPGAPMDPPVTWYRGGLPDGDYVAWIELSQEADFNASHNHPNQADTESSWDFEGHPFLGQPSVLFRVPFRLDEKGYTAVANDYAGYGAWDGSDGTLHLPDGTISTGSAGTGAGRLLDSNDGTDVYRMKVVVGSCAGDGGLPVCLAPDPATELALSAVGNELDVSFRTPAGGVAPNRFSVRYHEGDAPITSDNFNSMLASDAPPVVGPGEITSSRIRGLMPSTAYTVGVVGVSPCGLRSPVVWKTAATEGQKFATLHGCFVATAAFGTPMAEEVDSLRRLRDQKLLDNPAGRLFVATYYAFSPPLARAIAADRHLRAAVRAGLQPLVDLAARLAPN